jgi:PPOX class probable F420-dependent enzyme
VEGELTRWQREDQPAFARVHVGEPQHVTEEGACRLRVLGKDDRVRPGNHLPRLPPEPASLLRMHPPHTHVDLLERPLFAHLATVRPDGSPQVNPMWFLWDAEQGVLKLTHTKERHNYRYLQQEPRVALSITDPDDQYRYLQVRGVVDSIEDDPTGHFFQVLSQRYRGRTGDVPDRHVRVIFTVRPTAFKTR